MDVRSSPLLVTFDPGVSPPRSKIEKSITRSTVVSPVRQTCSTVADRVCCEKHSAAWSVTAGVVNYLCFAVIGDRRSACGDIRQSGELAYLFYFFYFINPHQQQENKTYDSSPQCGLNGQHKMVMPLTCGRNRPTCKNNAIFKSTQ